MLLLVLSLFGQYGVTGLYVASAKGNIDIVEILLANGADVDDKDNVSTIYNMII